MSQFFSVVKKNALEKRRNIRVTCCECFSHLALILLLAAGFQLSSMVKTVSQNYVKLDIFIPPTFITDRPTTTVSNIPTTTLNSSTPAPTRFNINRPPIDLPFDINIFNLFGSLQVQLNGPVIIPPFDAYIFVAQYISNQFKQISPRFSNRVLSSSTGRIFGNLLNLGTLHFCPFPSDEVKSLIDYLNTTTVLFRTMSILTHRSEVSAVRYILANPDQRAFALIVIHQITPLRVNYEIRQNYSTLPNSNRIVNQITTGILDPLYQGYLYSGFLTLEDTIDRWAVDYGIKKMNISETCTLPTPLLIPMPTYEFDGNPFYASIGSILGLALTMSTLYPVSRLIKNVVEEKEPVRMLCELIRFHFL